MNFCLYHAHCYDGFVAAWAVWTAYPTWTFIPVEYGRPVPSEVFESDAGTVLIVDFSYPEPWLQRIVDHAEELVVLDHHKTSQEALESFEHPKATLIFDMERSGAALAWDFIYGGGGPLPGLVAYVQDRDLWRWELPDSREINAWIRTHDLDDFETFNTIASLLDNPESRQTVVEMGRAIYRHQAKMVRLAMKSARNVHVQGYKVPAVNSCLYQSEIGSELAKGNPFAVVWYRGGDGRIYHSLRSTSEGEDVGEIARKLGGGGHRNAAGIVTNQKIFL